MNIQEIYDKVARHLLVQNAKSINEIPDAWGISTVFDCAYRGDNGAMCAVGCLINDDAYSKTIESKSIEAEEVKCALRVSGINSYDEQIILLLGDLQMMHDSEEPCHWKSCLKEIAEEFELNPIEE